MIPETVVKRAAALSSFWNEVFAEHRRLQLDGGWLSLGVLDLLLNPFRGRGRLLEGETATLNGVSAYLAVLSSQIWRHLPEPPEIFCEERQAEEYSLTIRAKSAGLTLFTADIGRSLNTIAVDPPQPFPVFANCGLQSAPSSGIISYYASGLFTGTTPFAEGPWINSAPESLAPRIEAVTFFGSDTTAAGYAELFPLEAIGARPEFYAPFMIFPPLGCYEQFPAVRGVASAIDYCKQFAVSAEDRQTLFRNLTMLPDQTLSSIGLAVSCALSPGLPEGWLRNAVDAFRPRLAALRPAVVLARMMLGAEGDWLKHLANNDLEQARRYAELDYQMGLLPYLIMPVLEHLDDPRLRGVFLGLAWSHPASAAPLIDYSSLFGALPPAILLQQARLALSFNRIDAAEPLLKEARDNFSDAEHELLFAFYKISAELEAKRQNLEETLTMLEAAFRIPSSDAPSMNEIAPLLAGGLVAQQKLDQAQEICTAALERYPNMFGIRLHQTAHALATKDSERADELLAPLVKQAPTHPQVFYLLKSQLLERYTEKSF